MAQLAIAAVGALALGPVGLGLTTAGTGFMLGSLAYSLMAPGQKSYGPRLNDLKVTGTEYGAAIPWIAGNPRVAGQIIWASERRETATEEEQGKGGGPTYTSYTYDVDLLILLSENEIAGVSRIWSNGELIFSAGVPKEGVWLDMRVYAGGDDQLPDPTYEAAVGVGNTPAYRGMGTVMIQGLQLGNGGNIPNLTFEIGDYSVSPVFEFGNQHLVNGSSGAVFSGEQYVTPERGATFEAWVRFNRSDVFTNTWVIDIASSDGKRVLLRMESNSGGAALYLYDLIGANPFYLKYPDGFTVGREFHFAIDFSPLEYLSQARRTVATVYQDGVALGHTTIDFTTHAEMSLNFKSAANFEGDIFIRAPRLVHSQRLYTAPFVPPANPVNVVVPGQLRPVPRPLAAVLHDLLERAQYPSTDLVVSGISNEVRSLAIGQVSNTRSALEALQQVFFFECGAVDVISIRPRAVNPVATIPFVDLGMGSGSGGDDEPLALTLGNDLELPAQLALSYPNMAGDYQVATEFSDRLLSGQQSSEAIQTAVGLLPAEAKGVVDGLLMDRVASLASTTLKLPLKYAYLEPGDVVNAINSDGRAYRLRVQSKTDAMPVIELQCVLDDVGAIESDFTTDAGYISSETVIQPAGTLFEALDIPILRDTDDAPGYYVAVAPKRAAETDKWPGAVIAQSWDGVNYAQLLKTTAQCVMGAATTVLGNWLGGPVFDERNTVTVQIFGELASSTRDAMLVDDSINALLLGSEVLRFRSAALLSPGTYLLSGLLRGQRGTEWAMGSHVVGERCVLLGAAMRRVTSQTSEIGLARQVKAVTMGRFLSDAMPKDFSDTGVALKPFSPANPRVLADGGDLLVTWQRRTQRSYQYAGAAPVVPLGEATETYRVRVYVGAALKRSDVVTAAAYRYTSDMRATDSVASGAALQFEICQLSAAVGPGYPSTVGAKAP